MEFTPPLPPQKLQSLDKLEMGKVIRIVLRVRPRFCDTISPSGDQFKTLSNMSFLFSEEDWFPTWWTAMKKVPIITAGRHSVLLSAYRAKTIPSS